MHNGRQDPQADTFGVLLRAARVEAGLTIEELAAHSGVSGRAISDMERGRIRRPQRRTVTALLDALPAGDRSRKLLEAAAEPAPRAPAEHTGWCRIPAPAQHFTGRDDALRTLTTLASGLREPDAPAGPDRPYAAVVLTGPPGVGKSALALRAAADLAGSFPDGRLFVDLRGMADAPTPAPEALRLLLLALGVTGHRIPRDPADRAGAYRALLRRRRLLVVLDNAADESQVRPLLPDGGTSLVVVTSRRRLSGLESVRWLPLDPLPEAEAVALIRALRGPQRTGEDPGDLAELVRHCGYLPLALRIVGRQLRGRTARAMNRRFAEEGDRITVIDAGGSGVTVALESSYRRLSPPARRVFRRLGLIPGPDFAAELAAVVAGEETSVTERWLDELVELGLVQPRADQRYGLHDLVRVYTGDRMAREEPDDRRLRERMIRWLLATASVAGEHFEPEPTGAQTGRRVAGLPGLPDAAAAMAWLDGEVGNWFPALRMAAEDGLHELVVDVADALHWFSDRRLDLDIWVDVFGLGARAATALGDAAIEARHLNYFAWAQGTFLDDGEAAIRIAAAALDRAVAAGDVAEQGWALAYASTGRFMLGEFEESLDLLLRAAELFRRAGDRNGLPHALQGQAGALNRLGRHDEALRVLEETLRLISDPGFGMVAATRLPAEALAHLRIGMLHAVAERWAESAQHLRAAVAGFHGIDMRTFEATAAVELAGSLRRTGEVDEARSCLDRAMALAEAQDDTALAARAGEMLAGLS